jgi:hypothetical protein
MGSREPTWSERIRNLIEEVDRVRGESEQVRGHAERAMKEERFWPDRRQAPGYHRTMINVITIDVITDGLPKLEHLK